MCDIGIDAMIRLEGIDHVALTVRNVERSVEWYQSVLGLERRHQDAWGSYPAMVGIGTTQVAFFPVSGSEPEPSPRRDQITMLHLAFRIDRSGFVEAQTALRDRGVDFELQDHGIAHSIYFSDPDGHELEVTTYEV